MGISPAKLGRSRGDNRLQPIGAEMEPLAEAGSTAAGPRVTVREIDAADAEACARICFEAFGALHDHHRVPRDFPTLDAATDMIEALISDPSIWGVAAQVDGRVVG